MNRTKHMTDAEIKALPIAAAGDTFPYPSIDDRWIDGELNLVLLDRFDRWVRLPARMARIERAL